MRSSIRRAGALVLAFTFLMGGVGLAAVDALAFHRAGSEQARLGTHFEPAGTTCGHGDRCVLGATFPGPRLAPLAPPAEVALTDGRVHSARTAYLPDPPLPDTAGSRPRAPPFQGV